MAWSRALTSIALLLFISSVSSSYSPPAPTTRSCPKLDACVSVANLPLLKLGKVPPQCCGLIGPLVGLDAALCLCTAIQVDLLGIIKLDVPIDVKLLVNQCGKQVPDGFHCNLKPKSPPPPPPKPNSPPPPPPKPKSPPPPPPKPKSPPPPPKPKSPPPPPKVKSPPPPPPKVYSPPPPPKVYSPPPPPKVYSPPPPPPKVYSPPPPPPKVYSPPPPKVYSPPPPPPKVYSPPPPPPKVYSPPPPTPKVYSPPPPPTPPTTSSPPPPPPPAPKQHYCPKFNACLQVLSLPEILLGPHTPPPCCSLIKGLVDVDTDICLCAAIKLKAAVLKLNVPLALDLVFNQCTGHMAPSTFKCY